MQILHIDLKLIGDKYAEFRYFWDNPNNYQCHRLPLEQISNLIKWSITDYYTRLPEDYTKTGQLLYNWLDGTERLLANALNQPHSQGLIIALATDERLAHLPWELLHDGHCFLVEKQPPIIPVRWVSMSNGQPIALANSPQNRPLNVLFMATSPLGVEPELDYEAEEGKILEATKRTPINLRVEESGCLTELSYVVRADKAGYYDVFHLTGHATYKGGRSCFLTEDEYGNQVDSSASEIVKALARPLPPLVFLSGCRTGYSFDAAVLSMAEELLNNGATAVLSWGERVRDTDATAAAHQLYWELSQGVTVTAALASTYQALIQRKIPDWHKLRLYVATTLPEALVTPLRTKGRKQLPRPTISIEFRDDENRLRVVSREEFVGRRRQLQNCLRTLKTDNDKVGVLIHGMGGWGKSSIASRLWDRLPDHEKVLWWRQIDESSLIKKLRDKLINPAQQELIPHLENSQIPLKSRFVYLFNQLAELGEKPFLLILDDFEWNLESRAGRYILKPKVAPILEALVGAIGETGSDNRILITCRYDFNSDLLAFFYKQGLEPLKEAELTKKLNRLKHFRSDKLPNDVRNRALTLAYGNPRLLEFINEKILGQLNAEAKLAELEQSPELWKDKIIWPDLYQLIDEPLQQVLSNCLVYELPVPWSALEAVCQSVPNGQQQLQRGLELGLIETSPEPTEEERVYRGSRILPHIISDIRLPSAPAAYLLYQKASEKLFELWGNQENESKEQWREIFRLALANRENPSRFRECFYRMLAVQYNSKADSAYESELRKVADDLVDDGLCTQLEDYLRQGMWKEADEETAWIFYQVMVKENYEDWQELLKNFPCDTLKEINRLWLQNSNGKFGISIQVSIYQSLGGTKGCNEEVWQKFCEEVGWENSLTYLHVLEKRGVLEKMREAEAKKTIAPALPVLIYTRWQPRWVRGVCGLGCLIHTRVDICWVEEIEVARDLVNLFFSFSGAKTCNL